MKKLLAITSALSMLVFAGVSFAAEPQQAPAAPAKKVVKVNHATYKASVATARTEVPEQAVLYGFETEKNIDTLKFRDNDAYIEYKAEVDNVLNKLVELEIHGSNIAGSTTIKYTATGIMDIIKKAYPDARNIAIEQKQEGNNFYYEAEFIIDKGEVEAKINPFTGAFAHTEIDFK